MSAEALYGPAACRALDHAKHAAELLHRAAQCRASAAVTSLPDMVGILYRLSTAFDEAAHLLLDEIAEQH
jgi:hypothetical protein